MNNVVVYCLCLVCVASCFGGNVQITKGVALVGEEPSQSGWHFLDANGDGNYDGVQGTIYTLDEINAVDTNSQAYKDAEAMLEPCPEPSVTVPLVDTNGLAIGTARLVVDAATMEPIAVTNSASPVRVWSAQRTDIRRDQASDNTLRQDCRDVKAEIATNKVETQDIVVTGETAAVKSLKKELVDCHTEIEHLRDIVKGLVKASE